MVPPFTTPPVYPPAPPGKFAATIQRSSPELLDQPLGAPDVSKCRVAILGLADDTGVVMNHGRPGARDGPATFRAALARYGVAARMSEARIGPSALVSEHGTSAFARPAYPHVFDAGDVIPGKSLSETHERVSAAALKLMQHGLIVVGIGGGHDLTYPLVRALHQFRREAGGAGGSGGAGGGETRPLVGVYADAHLDVRAEPGSGMAFRAMIDHGYVGRLTNIGASWAVNAAEHAEWFAANGGVFDEASSVDELLRGRERELPWPDFVSLDVDVLDASAAPGVSAVNPAGMSARELERVAFAAGVCPRVRLIDIMEFNPVYDVDHRTARVVAHLFLSFLAGLAERRA
ncbi:MAG: arginase family protein [Phycisphaerales bacterium]